MNVPVDDWTYQATPGVEDYRRVAVRQMARVFEINLDVTMSIGTQINTKTGL